jgi:hypothetical protein
MYLETVIVIMGVIAVAGQLWLAPVWRFVAHTFYAAAGSRPEIKPELMCDPDEAIPFV